MWRNIFVILICTLLLSLWGFYLAIRPFRFTTDITPKDLGVAYENVEFKTQDNITIRGWFIPNPKSEGKAIILLHGYPADKGNILPSRLFLHKKYNLLFIDFRYFGQSGGKYSTAGKNEVLDVLAAVKFLQERHINRIGVWGFSMGASVALMAAPRTPAIKAIVAESGYARLDWMATDYFKIPLLRYPLSALLRLWGILFLGYDFKSVSPVTSASELTIPILFLHSKNDNVIPFYHAELFQKQLANKPNVQFIFFDNLQHGEAPPNYKMVEDFFDRNL